MKVGLDSSVVSHQIYQNRAYLMGCAMLLVIIFHFFCNVANPIGKFNIGYIGVDVFLFLSGFGLAYSYEKVSITKFYINRFKRVYPLYFIAVCLTYLIYNLDWSYLDLLANITTVGFYVECGVHRYDWYLESLFTLYLLFPILYRYSRLGIWGLLSLFLLIVIILYLCELPWYYDCLVGRLPIFLYGIIFKKSTKLYWLICVTGIVLYAPCKMFISPFLASACIAIPLINILLLLIRLLPIQVYNMMSYIGRNTLEIYIANLFIIWLFQMHNFELWDRLVIYISMQLVLTIILIVLNKQISRLVGRYI